MLDPANQPSPLKIRCPDCHVIYSESQVEKEMVCPICSHLDKTEINVLRESIDKPFKQLISRNKLFVGISLLLATLLFFLA